MRLPLTEHLLHLGGAQLFDSDSCLKDEVQVTLWRALALGEVLDGSWVMVSPGSSLPSSSLSSSLLSMTLLSQSCEERNDALAVIEAIIADDVLFTKVESDAGNGKEKFEDAPCGIGLAIAIHGAGN